MSRCLVACPLLRKIPLLAVCAAFAAAAPSSAKDIPTDGLWRGTGNASFSSSAGNSRSMALGLETAWRRATMVDKWTADARARYARSRLDGTERTTTNQWSASAQYDRNIGDAVYGFGKLGLESDAVVDLDLRRTWAGGLGYKWWVSDDHNASVFAGIAHSSDRYASPQTIDGVTTNRATRRSVLVGQESSHALTDTTTLKQRLEIYPGVSGDRAVLTRFNASMAVAVNARFSVTLGLSLARNSQPPLGSRRDDIGLLAGLSLRFGAD